MFQITENMYSNKPEIINKKTLKNSKEEDTVHKHSNTNDLESFRWLKSPGDNAMGCYDIVNVPCPKCGEKQQFQSKSGSCCLSFFELDDCPADVMMDINRHAPATCKCGTQYYVGCNFALKFINRNLPMDTNSIIKAFDRHFDKQNVGLATITREEWQTLKAAVLAQQSTNKQMEAITLIKELVEYRKRYYSVDSFFRSREERINAVIA